MEPFSIEEADTPEALDAVRELFREYGATPGVRECVHTLDSEIAALPGSYAPPDGALLLGVSGEEGAGCVAIRKVGEGACEMKRLYVRPAHRGGGLGRMLVEEVIGAAFRLGYNRILLDTLPSMRTAAVLYKSYGFVPTEPYLEQPTPGALCFELRLA